MRKRPKDLKNKHVSKGVRRIKPNYMSLTGQVKGQEFESTLERDLLLRTHWDYEVRWYQSQPLKLQYLDNKEVKRTYTPDLLIVYAHNHDDDEESILPRKNQLCEVKYRKDLALQWPKLKPKIRAARKYAKNEGWEFKIFTEKEIRTPYLENIRFLWSYRFSDFDEHHYDKLMMGLDAGETTPYDLLQKTYNSKILRGEAMWTLWCMIARLWVSCDLTQPFNMKSRIWV